MDEQSFLDRLRSTPGDSAVLGDYAAWLIDRGDPRGEHLAAELAVHDAETRLFDAQQHLYSFRGNRTQDFKWLDSVLPMTAKAPADGIFYAGPSPDEPPFVRPGDFCHNETVVGVVESQKVFFQIAAGHCGVVSEVLVTDGAAVSFGDIIVRMIRPQKPPDAVEIGS